MEDLCPLYKICKNQGLRGYKKQVSLYNQNAAYVESVRQEWQAKDRQMAEEALGLKSSKDCRGDKLQTLNRFRFSPQEDKLIEDTLEEPVSDFYKKLESKEISG